MNQPGHSPDYYRFVFDCMSKMLRIYHRECSFGFITVVVNRTSFNIRWTVRRRGYKKFVHETPVTFDSLIGITPTELYKSTEEIIRIAKSQLPKELIHE